MSPAQLREKARQAADRALETLVDLLDSEHEQVRLKAADSLLVRGYGRPAPATDDPAEDFGSLPAEERLRLIDERMQMMTRYAAALRAELAGADLVIGPTTEGTNNGTD